jgi:hypothetical protein
MKKLVRLAAVAAVTALPMLTMTSRAEALEPSTRGPFYAQLKPLGVGFSGVCAGIFGCSVGGSYHLDAEFGYHFMGHHDGFVAAVRQSFYLSGGSAGTTQARLGWDIAIPISNFELTIAPYATLGIFYGFSGGDPAFAFGIGVEGKFFFLPADHAAGGLYAFFRPFEGGAGISSASFFLANLGAGIGYAF